MKTRLLKRLRRNIKLHHCRNTGEYYLYDGYYGDIYTAEKHKIQMLYLTTIPWHDKEGRLSLAKYYYRKKILNRARSIYLPIRIKNQK